jgi:sulfate/thiosulfate transport system substrate-binding protein
MFSLLISRARTEELFPMNVLRQRRGRLTAALTMVAVAALGLSACGSNEGSSSGSSGSKQLNLVGFAVIKSAYDELGTSFAKTDAGKGVKFKGSFGASGAQSRAVIAGQKADVVALSLSPDVKNIAEAGKIDAGWDSGPTKGIVSTSVVVIAVRKGNPKQIKGWADIVKPGVGIVTADPGTSGSAKWNLLAAYSQALGTTKDEAAAKTYLGSFVKNVVSWNDSGRTATDAFVKGTGDVLISYENEAIAARAAGVELDYIVPDATFLIENPAAVTKTAPPAAAEFLTYITGPEGQKIFASKGFRPLDPSVTVTDVKGANDAATPFPKVTTLTTVADLGGWSAVNDSIFDKDKGLVAELRK